MNGWCIIFTYEDGSERVRGPFMTRELAVSWADGIENTNGIADWRYVPWAGIDKEKMELQHKIITSIHVDFVDLENFIQKIYPHLTFFGKGKDKYEFVPCEVCDCNSSHTFEVDGISISNKDLDRLRHGLLENYDTRNILNLLCKDGFIVSGTYLINVCW